MQRRPALKFVLLSSLLVRHLFPAENKPLLNGRDAFFFFDAFFYAGDLWCGEGWVSVFWVFFGGRRGGGEKGVGMGMVRGGTIGEEGGRKREEERETDFIIGLDVQFYFFAGECADSVCDALVFW